MRTFMDTKRKNGGADPLNIVTDEDELIDREEVNPRA
jgi:hypothetical protein